MENYEEWDLSPVQMPARSTLYALEPIGVGTAFVESLTSYIARLASAHCVFVGVLMNKFLAPALTDLFHGRGKTSLLVTNGGRQPKALNGANICTQNAVQVLEHFTQRQGLCFLTLLTWSKVFPPVNLMRDHRAWCPICYDEWKAQGRTVYDPLLWTLQEVSICSRHDVHLSSSCPYQDCQREQFSMGWRLRPGHCSYCGRWLGVPRASLPTTNTRIHDDKLSWQQWVALTLGDLLALAPAVTAAPSRQRVTDMIHLLVQQVSQGSHTAFEQAVGVSKRLVAHWLKGSKLPRIDGLLRVCYALDLSLADFLLSDMKTLQPHLMSERIQKLPDRKPRLSVPTTKINKMQETLEDALRSDAQPPPTVIGIARQFGYTSDTLYERWPELCHVIAAHYLAYVSARKAERMQRLRTEVREAALQLYAEGKSITRNHIASRLPKSGYLRSPEVRGFVEEMRRELEEPEESG